MLEKRNVLIFSRRNKTHLQVGPPVFDFWPKALTSDSFSDSLSPPLSFLYLSAIEGAGICSSRDHRSLQKIKS